MATAQEKNTTPKNELPDALPDDPGGAHSKGYSANGKPDVPVPEEGPLPLAPAPAATSQVKQPERDGRVRGEALELRGCGGVIPLPPERDGHQPPLLGVDGRAGDAVRGAPERRVPRARAHRAGVTAPP